jgi:hypothetical protein
LKTTLFKNGGDRKVERCRAIPTNIEKCIEGTHGRSIMVEKCIDEIGPMEKSKKQKKQSEDEVKSMKVEEGIGNIERGRGISLAGSRNVKVNG